MDLNSLIYHGEKAKGNTVFIEAEKSKFASVVAVNDGVISNSVNGKEFSCSEIKNCLDSRNPNILENAAGGFEADITTLTDINRDVVSKTFYDLGNEGAKLSDYLSIVGGVGAWNTQILTYLKANQSDSFEKGLRGLFANSKIEQVDIQFDTTTHAINNWAKQFTYDIFEFNTARTNAGINFDIVQEKAESLKEDWDLGIQEHMFLGHSTDTNFPGILTQATTGTEAVTVNTSTISSAPSSMTDTAFNTFLSAFVNDYWVTSNRTRRPDTFLISTDERIRLAGRRYSGTFKYDGSRLQALNQAMKEASGNENAKVMDVAYCDAGTRSVARQSLPANINRFALFRRADKKSLRMDVPIDFTLVTTNYTGQNNLQYQSGAYGQYTGVKVFKRLELLYFQY